MKALHLTAAAVATAALMPAAAQAQYASPGVLAGPLYPQPGSGSLYPSGGSLYPTPMPRQDGFRSFGHGRHGGFGGTWILEAPPRVVHDVVVVHDEPAERPAPPAPPPPPRPAYVIGHSYSSLPGGCMKLVDRGVSYFQCSGDWYREVGRRQYKAVSRPL